MSENEEVAQARRYAAARDTALAELRAKYTEVLQAHRSTPTEESADDVIQLQARIALAEDDVAHAAEKLAQARAAAAEIALQARRDAMWRQVREHDAERFRAAAQPLVTELAAAYATMQRVNAQLDALEGLHTDATSAAAALCKQIEPTTAVPTPNWHQIRLAMLAQARGFSAEQTVRYATSQLTPGPWGLPVLPSVALEVQLQAALDGSWSEDLGRSRRRGTRGGAAPVSELRKQRDDLTRKIARERAELEAALDRAASTRPTLNAPGRSPDVDAHAQREREAAFAKLERAQQVDRDQIDLLTYQLSLLGHVERDGEQQQENANETLSH